MERKRSDTAKAMAIVVVALALAASVAAAKGPEPDRCERAPGLAQAPIGRIALLPVVSVAENPDAERLVEGLWTEYCGAGATWVGADAARSRMDDSERDRLVSTIWRTGDTEPALAAELAERLDVDAVMIVRIDRWEIVNDERAVVEIKAVLRGADGAPLWSISGTAGCGVAKGSHADFDQELTWMRRPSTHGDEKLAGALCGLLGRWSGSMPSPEMYAKHDGGTPAASTGAALD
jgi:hypothetical protein